MKTLATGLSYFDLEYLGTPRIIATGIVHGAAGVSIIDPGPATTLPALRAGLARSGMSLADVRSILLTHIHLDHAGATGVILREHPSIRVYVHTNGAAAPGRSEQAAGKRHPLVGRRYGPAVGRGRAGADGSVERSCGRRADLGGRSRPRGCLHAGTRLASRELLQRRRRHCLRRRYGRRPAVCGRLQHAADAAARHRSRRVAPEPRDDRGLATVNRSS